MKSMDMEYMDDQDCYDMEAADDEDQVTNDEQTPIDDYVDSNDCNEVSVNDLGDDTLEILSDFDMESDALSELDGIDETEEISELSEEEIQEAKSEIADDTIQYEMNGYQYEKNADGQILYAGGDLKLEEAERNNYAQRIAGGEYRHELDDGGHLIATRFGGSGELDNLVAEDRTVNRGAFKTFENQWAKELEDGNQVHVDITPLYHGDSERPDTIMGKAEITSGEDTVTDYFSMTNENLESEEFELPKEADEMLDLW